MHIDDNSINEKINYIFSIIDLIESKINNIDIKIKEITNIYILYQFNKNLNLKHPNSYLKFQIDLLYNDKKYYNYIKKILVKKFTDELIQISENIIVVFISMEDLDIGFRDEKTNIIKKISKIKKNNVLNKSKIYELINITSNNLKQTNKFLELFEKFIRETDNNNKKNNIHSKNLEINLENKKCQYEIEFKKYLKQFILLLEYFESFCISLNKQIKNQETLNFFVNKVSE